MSLINDALKKAQKLRTGDPATLVPPMPGGASTVEKLGQPRSTQQLVVMAAGALALVVLSVVVTFWFVNRPSASSPAPAPVAVKTAANSTPPPTIVAPAVTPPVVAEKPAPKPAAPSTSQPVVTGPAATPPGAGAELAPVVPPPATVATAAPEASAPSAAVPTDPRIHAFVDAIKVMGIRSSGGDSRVLMNDRVFRVNDIVERTLGVRLISVAPDSLTFSDSNGGIYVKYF